MKYKKSVIKLCILLLYVVTAFGNPLIVVSIMIKNEAGKIQETLQPFVDGGITDFMVFDTGSTDGTQNIVRTFFKKNNITNGHIVEEPFINFATSRNRALEITQNIFPEATFMLMPDAEWYMHNTKDLLRFCANYKDHTDDSYLVRIKNDAIDFVTARLIRCRRDVRFVGVVHETLNKGSAITVYNTCYFEWRPSAAGQKKSALRWQRDRDLLLAEHLKNPTDSRTLFYLAQTYDCLGDHQKAYEFYKKRTQAKGWDEENFMAMLRLGSAATHLDTTQKAEVCPLSVQHYLEAFNLRSSRAEPLIKIAQYYKDKNMMALAFMFAQRAANIQYPEHDRLFVEKYLYDFVRYDLLGISAWYIGEYEIGERAVRKALEIKPNAPHLHYNLKLYTDRKTALESK
ncbi:MAG: hypothetical protein NT124_05220 [Candidatus Dependentiae bacterium]|nr:hypothetical protein [Candidatus Dependentiae bacterium]